MTAGKIPPETFGDLMRRLRERKGLTKAEIGSPHANSLRAIEQNESRPGDETVRRLAALYGVGVEELLRERDRQWGATAPRQASVDEAGRLLEAADAVGDGHRGHRGRGEGRKRKRGPGGE